MRFSATVLLLSALRTGCVGGTLLITSHSASAAKTPAQKAAQYKSAQQKAARNEIEALYTKITASFLKKDPTVLAAMLAPKLTAKTIDGKTQNREEWIKDTAEGFKNTKSVQAAHYTIGNIKATAGERTVEVVCKMAVIIIDPGGRMGTRSKTHKLEQTIPSRDTWNKVHGKWLLTKWEERPGMKTFVDGKSSSP